MKDKPEVPIVIMTMDDGYIDFVWSNDFATEVYVIDSRRDSHSKTVLHRIQDLYVDYLENTSSLDDAMKYLMDTNKEAAEEWLKKTYEDYLLTKQETQEEN